MPPSTIFHRTDFHPHQQSRTLLDYAPHDDCTDTPPPTAKTSRATGAQNREGALGSRSRKGKRHAGRRRDEPQATGLGRAVGSAPSRRLQGLAAPGWAQGLHLANRGEADGGRAGARRGARGAALSPDVPRELAVGLGRVAVALVLRHVVAALGSVRDGPDAPRARRGPRARGALVLGERTVAPARDGWRGPVSTEGAGGGGRGGVGLAGRCSLVVAGLVVAADAVPIAGARVDARLGPDVDVVLVRALLLGELAVALVLEHIILRPQSSRSEGAGGRRASGLRGRVGARAARVGLREWCRDVRGDGEQRERMWAERRTRRRLLSPAHAVQGQRGRGAERVCGQHARIGSCRRRGRAPCQTRGARTRAC